MISNFVQARFMYFVALSLIAILHRVGRNPDYSLERKSQEWFLIVQTDIEKLLDE